MTEEVSSNITELAAASKRINEGMFYDKVRSTAASRGVRVKTRDDVKKFIRSSVVASANDKETAVVEIRPRLSDDKPLYSDIDPITSRQPGGSGYLAPTSPLAGEKAMPMARKHVTVVPAPVAPAPAERTREQILRDVLQKLPPSLKPVRVANGYDADDTSIRLECDRGHVHRYYLLSIDENKLSGCHTCLFKDQYMNDIRLFMEAATAYPFIIDSRNRMLSEKAQIHVYCVKEHRTTNVWSDKGILNCVVQTKKGCVNSLRAKLRKSTFKLPDGRYIRNLLGDDTICFDDTIVDTNVMLAATPSVTIPAAKDRYPPRDPVLMDVSVNSFLMSASPSPVGCSFVTEVDWSA